MNRFWQRGQFLFLASIFLLLTIAFVSNANAQTKTKKITTVEGITEYQLDNGVRYLLFPDPSSATVTVNLTLFVGSRHEGYGETGMAHLLEHMLFKGSKKFPDVDQALEKHGASFNGTTWVDRTNYYETMPATDENLAFAIEFEADRLLNCFIKREDLAKEMTVVRNEFEIGENNPENILSQRMMATAYEWHNYGKSTIGNRTDIERVPVDNLREFYTKFYQPDNCMVVIAGKFDEEKAHQYMSKFFGVLPRPKRQLPTTYTEEPTQDGERVVLLRRTGAVQVVGAIYHTPAAAHPDCAATQVLEEVLTAVPSGRLYKALVETKKATSVSGFAPAWHDPGVLEIIARVAPNADAKEVQKIMLDTLENLHKNPITKEEVDRAKRRLIAQWERAFTKSNAIAVQISEWAGAGDWRLMFLHRDRIDNMTAEQVNAAAKKYLKTSNRTVGMFIPTEAEEIVRADIPPAPNVQDLVKGYKGREGIVKGEAFEPTPENIEKRVQRTVLPSGIKVALLPKKTRGESVVATIKLHFGNEKSLNPVQTACEFVGPMLSKGTEKYSQQELKDALDKLKATISADSGLGSLNFTIQAKRDTLPEVLDILEEVMRRPTFPQKEFDILKRAALVSLKKALKEPNSLAVNAIQRKLSPYPKTDIRYVHTIEESIELLEKLTRDDIVDLYKKQIGGTVGEIAVVGDFVPDEFLAKMKSMTGNWKSGVPYARITQKAHPDLPGSKTKIVTPDKANALYVAGYQLAMKDTDPDFAAMTLGNHVLGASGLNSILFNRLRGEEGLSYGAGSQLSVSSQDEYSMFLIFALCNPKNVGKVDSTTFEVLETVKKNGLSGEQFSEARKGWLEKQKVARSQDGTLAAMLRNGLYLNRTFEYYADLDRKVEKLSVTEVNDALRDLIQPNRLIVIEAGDFRAEEKK